jgi:hypothetical protein
MTTLNREELGLKIYEVARDVAEGYNRNVSQHNTVPENDTAEKCAVAASNTGFFILTALGYTKTDLDRFRSVCA